LLVWTSHGYRRAALRLEVTHLSALARGTAILGAGGGGDSRVGLLAAQQACGDYGPVELVDLDDLPADGLVLPCGLVGAPTVTVEKIINGSECERLREHVERHFGAEVVALMPAEIGGLNGVQPIAWAARMGLPVADADGMGRAFPELTQSTLNVAGIAAGPAFLTDERGLVLVVHADSAQWLERIVRKVTAELGGLAAMTDYVLTVEQARSAAVRGSVTRAMRLGQALTDAESDALGALIEELSAHRLITGKVVDVERRTTGGFVRGHVLVEGLQGDAQRLLRLEIQNENLIALEEGEVRASVPDLITLLDSETADAVPTELLRYGQRLTVVAFPCDPIWRTPRGLELAGPRAFGYELDYAPIEELYELASL
jgi:uncharacterized protein